VSYHCTEISYIITIAVQIQLQYSQAPKWRPSSILAEAARNWLKILFGGVCGGGGALISTALLARAMRHPVAPGYTAAGLIHVYQSGVSFLSFHLSLCRESCTVVDKNAHTIGARQVYTSLQPCFP
jgi:hypothetical protein